MKIGLDDLALEFSEEYGESRAKSKRAIIGLFEVIADNLQGGHEVVIPNFGKFRVKVSKARTGRNPKTGESIEIEAKRVPGFLAAKPLKEKVK